MDVGFDSFGAKLTKLQVGVCADRICLWLDAFSLEATYGELLGCCCLTANHSSDLRDTVAGIRWCISFSYFTSSCGTDSCTYGRDFGGDFCARVPGDSLSFELILSQCFLCFLW